MTNKKENFGIWILTFEIDTGAGFSHLNLPFRDLTP
jgi:hypothetical protein